MFIQKSMSAYSVSSFSPSNFVARCLNQLFVLAIALIFFGGGSFYATFLFLLTIPFNIFNFRIKFDKDPFLRYVLTNQIDYRPVSSNREKVFFLAVFCVALCFLLFKLSVPFLPMILKRLGGTKTNFIGKIPQFYSPFTHLIWQGDNFYWYDLSAQIAFLFVSFAFYWMNRDLKIYYDYYTVQIYKRVLTDFFKYALLACIVVLLLVKEVMMFEWNFMSFAENLIIVTMLIGLFLRFKVGNYKNLKRYLTIAKYVTIVRLGLYVSAKCFLYVFSGDFRFWLFKILLNETREDDAETGEARRMKKLILLIVLYYAYNITSFCIKFQRLFIFKDKSPFFGTLQTKPYKLYFINYFAKNLLSILRVIDIKKTVKHNLNLRFKFYAHLRKYTYFKMSFEYSFKSNNTNFGVSLKYSVYELLNKYWNIVDIYKYDVLTILLNTGMVVLFGTSIFAANIISIFYLGFALIIILLNNFKATWYAALAFVVGPSLILILMYAIINLEQELGTNLIKSGVENLLHIFGFAIDPKALNDQVHLQFAILVTTLIYIIVLMYMKNRGQVKQRYNIIENLKHRRMMIIDADEDVLFIVTSMCRFLLIIIKYVLILKVCSDALSYVSYINFCILFFVFLSLAYPSNYVFDCLTGMILSTFLLKFFARYDILFGSYESYKGFLFGLYFNTDLRGPVTQFSTSQEPVFLANYIMIYTLFTVKSLLLKTENSKFMENKAFKTKY